MRLCFRLFDVGELSQVAETVFSVLSGHFLLHFHWKVGIIVLHESFGNIRYKGEILFRRSHGVKERKSGPNCYFVPKGSRENH